MENKCNDIEEIEVLLKNSISTPIINFYQKKSLFITGGTGFLGAVLIEKFLYTINDINIYMLIKPKNGKTVNERMDDLMNSPVFQRIREKNPDALNNITPVVGDICEKDIGLNTDDIIMLQKEVSIVFHVAADVNFDAPLEDAISSNTRATQEVVKFCKGIQHLLAFVYVSTAYSNSHNNLIDEKVYKTCTPLKSAYYIVDEIGDNKLSRNLLERRPNTYTYSKALAEELIENEINKIPAVIVRPSVIISSLRDPVRGWVDGWSGPNGIVVALGKGLIRCWNGQTTLVSDLIPVDIVANLLIAAAWDTHEKRVEGENKLKVFNCCSGLQNPIKMGNFLTTCLYYTRKHQFKDVLYTPTLLIIKNRLLHLIMVFLLQTIPSIVMDAIAWLFGRKRRMMRIQRKLGRLASVLEYFTLHQFTFIDYNVRDLYCRMDVNDRKIFDFNVKNIKWESYLDHYVMGLKKYLLKES